MTSQPLMDYAWTYAIKLDIQVKRLLTVVVLCLPPLAAAVEQETIQTGDWLFVKARPMECDAEKRLVDFAEVNEAGVAALLGGLTIRASGKTEVEAAEMLMDSVEQRDGYRPQSIEILRADRADPQRRAILMMLVAESQRKPCIRQPEQVLPDWKPGYRVAEHGRADLP